MEHDKQYGNTIGPLGFPMLDKQARVLDILLKSLPKTKDYEYKYQVVTKAPTELNAGERSDVSWISTECVDRQGEVVISKGMNDSQFQGNPLVTLQHAYYLPPVGRSLWRKKTTDGAMKGIKAKTVYPARPESWTDPCWPPDKALALIQAQLLQGKSLGFLPTKAHVPDEKEVKKNGWPEGVRIVFDEWLLLEYACVFLPANQEALVDQVSKGLTLNAEILKAMNVTNLTPPVAPTGSPNVVVAFKTMSEIAAEVKGRIVGIDFNALVQKSIEESLARAQGRV